MYINSQQNQVKTQVDHDRAHKLFRKNRKLHKFATTNSNFKKIIFFKHASS